MACKCVFYRPEHNAKGGPHGTEFWRFWNISTDRAQTADGKNRAICLVIMFTPWVMVIKMSKMAHFCIFYWRQQKTSHSLGKTFKCTWKIFEFFQKIVWLISFRVTVHEISSVEIQKNCWVSQKIMKLCIFKGWYLANGSSESNNP